MVWETIGLWISNHVDLSQPIGLDVIGTLTIGLCALIISIFSIILTLKQIREKNINFEIEILKNKLDLYYIPLSMIMVELIVETHDLKCEFEEMEELENPEEIYEEEIEEDEIIESEIENIFENDLVLKANRITTQYAYLGSPEININIKIFIINFLYTNILMDNPSSEFQFAKEDFLKMMNEIYTTKNPNATIDQAMKIMYDYYKSIPEDITAKVALETCLLNLNKANSKIIHDIGMINNEIIKKTNKLRK